MKDLSLSKKVGFAFIVILLPIAIAFAYGYYNNKKALADNILDQFTVIAEAYEGQVYQFLEMNKRRAEDFASDGYIKRLLKEINEGRSLGGGAQ